MHLFWGALLCASILQRCAAQTASLPPLSGGKLPTAAPYMVDNEGNTHHEAPDNQLQDGPVLPPSNASAVIQAAVVQETTSEWWYPNMGHGQMPYAPSGYTVFRNVMDYGAKGDGVTDDTAAINSAATDGGRCGSGCNGTTTLGAVVYFPPGTYMVSSPIVQYFYTLFIGDVITPPTIKGSANFSGIALIDTDIYIPGGNGSEWYLNTSNFYRQIRNFNMDLTEMAESNTNGGQTYVPTGIHWQVAQATSLQNINFNMPVGGTTTAVGVFAENGSGGFMSDLTFTGGAIGMRVGSQQFTTRSLSFTSSLTAIEMIWDWGWKWKDITVNSCYVAISCTSLGGIDDQGTGSIVVLDSTFIGVPYGITINGEGAFVPNIYIDNLLVTLQGTADAVVLVSGGQTILNGPSSGSTTIKSWAMGNVVLGQDETVTYVTEALTSVPSKPSSLLASSGRFYTQSKPQYETLTSAHVISVLNHDVYNDGQHGDQSAAINAVLTEKLGKVIFFPAGIYPVNSTIFVPVGSMIVGEAWPQIMAQGSNFSDPTNPTVVVQVGNAGDQGTVEISDMLFTVSGTTPGAVLVEWNVHEQAQGSAAMWDSHFRIGGAQGSYLQIQECPPTPEELNEGCIAAALLLHLTTNSSGYFENVWAWVADHDIDNEAQEMIGVYAGRGVLIESQGPTWLYGSASEHSVLYQYQLDGAADIYLGHMQTESPYFQPYPAAPAPFGAATEYADFIDDPDFSNCGSTNSCEMSWALRILNSRNIYIYGAGFYSWFNNYDESCVDSETCQDALIDTSYSQSVWIYDLFTKGAYEVITPEGLSPVYQKDTQSGYTTVVAAWLALALSGAGIGGEDGDPGENSTPDGVGIIPLSCTSVAPSATFTLTSACASEVASLPFSGANNIPPGPSPYYEDCNLLRLLTATCCGDGGSIGNPVEIPSGISLPVNLPLPSGFAPSSPINIPGRTYGIQEPLGVNIILPDGYSPTDNVTIPTQGFPANVSLGVDVLLPVGYVPSFPLKVGGETYAAGDALTAQLVLGASFIPTDLLLIPSFNLPIGAEIPLEIGLDASYVPWLPLLVPAISIASGSALSSSLDVPAGVSFSGTFLLPPLFPLAEDSENATSTSVSSESSTTTPTGIITAPYWFVTDPASVDVSISSAIDARESTWSDSWIVSFSVPTVVPTTTGPAPPTTTDPAPTTSDASPTASPTPPTVSGWAYLGCFTDQSDRTLNGAGIVDDSLTAESCASYCQSNGFTFFGVEYGTQCYCGDEISDGSSVDPSNCNMSCAGDADELCGASWYINVYDYTATPTTGPTSTTSTAPGSSSTPTTYVLIVYSQSYVDGVSISLWTAFQQAWGVAVAVCEGNEVGDWVASNNPSILDTPLPTGTLSMSNGCSYSGGTSTTIGTLSCPDYSSEIPCIADPQSIINCPDADGVTQVLPLIECAWGAD